MLLWAYPRQSQPQVAIAGNTTTISHVRCLLHACAVYYFSWFVTTELLSLPSTTITDIGCTGCVHGYRQKIEKTSNIYVVQVCGSSAQHHRGNRTADECSRSINRSVPGRGCTRPQRTGTRSTRDTRRFSQPRPGGPIACTRTNKTKTHSREVNCSW